MATDPTSNDGRKTRKSSVRDTLSGKRRPKASEANRRRYQNPVYLAQSRAAMRKIGLANKGKGGRPLGSYDGIRKDERERINAEAKMFAQETMKKMADKGIVTTEDDPRAVEALSAAVETMRKPANQQTKLAAAKLILEYTKAKPAAKSEVTLNKAEEWLAAITSEEKNDKADAEGTKGDAQAASE